jgi:hypothetical protein
MPGTINSVPAWTLAPHPADATSGRLGEQCQRRHQFRREVIVIEPRQMHLARRHHRRRAAMHVIGDPADGILCWCLFAEHRVDMSVDSARQHRIALGVYRSVDLGIGGRIQFGDTVALYRQRCDVADGVREIAVEEFADIGDQSPCDAMCPEIAVST